MQKIVDGTVKLIDGGAGGCVRWTCSSCRLGPTLPMKSKNKEYVSIGKFLLEECDY